MTNTQMRPTLILQPIHNSSADILKMFVTGQPLSADQLNFLEWHKQQLSGPVYDPIYRYYIEKTKRKHKYQTSFLLPHEIINKDAIEKLKKRLQIFLKEKHTRAVINVTQEQFLQFKQVNVAQLIFWHGNQLITGAPFFPGGIPPVIYFQWGNFFGVVKYVVLASEKTLKANVLIYFEDMQERNLDRCVLDYEKELQDDLQEQNKLVEEHKIEQNDFVIRTPTLSLDPFKKLHEPLS